MRISHHAILNGLPNEVGVVGSDTSRKEDPNHISTDLLWDLVKSGRALDKVHVKHTKVCRDCREFVWDFSREARATGLSFPDLLPPQEKQMKKAE